MHILPSAIAAGGSSTLSAMYRNTVRPFSDPDGKPDQLHPFGASSLICVPSNNRGYALKIETIQQHLQEKDAQQMSAILGSWRAANCQNGTAEGQQWCGRAA